jgi:hypothetical protein
MSGSDVGDGVVFQVTGASDLKSLTITRCIFKDIGSVQKAAIYIHDVSERFPNILIQNSTFSLGVETDGTTAIYLAGAILSVNLSHVYFESKNNYRDVEVDSEDCFRQEGTINTYCTATEPKFYCNNKNESFLIRPLISNNTMV